MQKRNRLYVVIVLLLMAAILIFRQRNTIMPAGVELNRSPAHLVYTRHAKCRMDCRHIDESEVKEILEKGIINNAKSDPAARPDPKYALEGTTRDNQQVRIVFAPSNGKMVVITVIDLEKEWKCDCK